MKQIPILPGKHLTVATLSTHDATGNRSAADSTPIVILFVDDGASGTFSSIVPTTTVTDRGAVVSASYAGNYAVQIDVDDLVASYDGPETYVIWGFWLWTMGGIDQSQPIEPFVLVPPTPAGYVLVDAGNTSTSFKVAAGGDFAWASASAAFALDDGPENMLVTFTTGALRGQTRRVTAYNATTGFLTVDSAFTSAPSTGDSMMFSNF